MDYEDEDFAQEDFDADAWFRNRPTLTEDRSHPNHWRNRSADLKASAGAIWYAMKNDKAVADALGYSYGHSMSVACKPVYHLTCGLALELIMKAVLVQRQTPIKKLQTHHLGKLHQLLGLDQDESRRKLLLFYQHALVWSGRYPVPMNADDESLKQYYQLEQEILTVSAPLSPGSFIKLLRSSGATDWEPFCELYDSYRALFQYP
jgi:hypothetical protein